MASSRMPAWANTTFYVNQQKRINFLGIALLATFLILGSFLFFGSAPEPAASPVASSPDVDASKGSSDAKDKQPIWLIATMSPVQGAGRRQLVRSTWQRMYKDDSLFKTVFFLARPPSDWIPIIEAENNTYGDLVVLDNIEETHDNAIHIKPFEFYKWLAQQGRQWPFVSKADDDSFVDPIRFSNKYLQPLLEEGKKKKLPPIVIGRKVRNRKDYDAPAGQLLTMTWETMEHVVRLHKENPVKDDEDALVGRLLHEGHVKSRFIRLENQFAFDYHDDTDGSVINGVQTAWAPDGADLTVDIHGVGGEAIVPHKMKTDDAYLRVAACFGPDGVLKKEEAKKHIGQKEHWWNLGGG